MLAVTKDPPPNSAWLGEHSTAGQHRREQRHGYVSLCITVHNVHLPWQYMLHMSAAPPGALTQTHSMVANGTTAFQNSCQVLAVMLQQ